MNEFKGASCGHAVGALEAETGICIQCGDSFPPERPERPAMNDVKLLPLPETLLRSGFKSSIEVFARACIEADRKERVGGGEAAAWRRRHPSEDAPSGWHDWIVSSEKPCKEYPDSEYQPLYPHPAPPDVARLVEADKEFDAANEAWDALDTRSIGDYGDPRDYDGPEYERLWRAIERRKEALAPFTATQQEVQS